MRTPSQRPFTVTEVAGAYVGTVVGAGFASGQEVLRFFTAFGERGALGLAVATLLSAAAGMAALRLGAATSAQSHRDVLVALGGPWLGRLADALVSGFLFAATGVMMAGSGAIAAEQFGLPEVAGSLGLAVLAALTVLSGLGGVVRVTAVIAPALIGAVVALAVATLLAPRSPSPHAPVPPAAPSWWLSGVLYASYNLVLALSVLAPLGNRSRNPRVDLQGAAAGAVALGLTALLIHEALGARIGQVAAWEVPMLELARQQSDLAAVLYAGVLWAEVYTTAVAGLYGVAARLAGEGPRFPATVLALAAAAFVLSRFGFASLVGAVYPAVGYLGLAVLALLLGRVFSGRTV